MRIRFDPDQSWQHAAIDSVVDVFAGQQRRELANPDGTWTNSLDLDQERLLENVRRVQERSDLPLSSAMSDLHLSIEMETGTGKTYAYLRTIYTLHRHYGWNRFCIAVPGVAIREGVLKNLEITATHFADLFDGVAVEWHIYDGNRTGSLRALQTSPAIQILIINIDAFNKTASNLIYRADDRLCGRRPIDLIAATRPVVVVDEPQNMESEAAVASIASLNPLCTLRYSATHRRRYHLLYQLDPVRAHDLGLVKSIEVCSVTDDANRPWVGVGDILQRPLRARVVVTAGSRKRLTVRVGDDLGKRTGRDRYDGWLVEAIADGAVHFDNGVSIGAGESWGDAPDRVARAQIEEAVRTHLQRERDVRDALGPGQMKVLTLFFIDRVARYTAAEAPIRRWFVDAWNRLIRTPEFAVLGPFPTTDSVHAGYFAERRKRAVDTRGRSRADEDAYSLIMRDKERLLDPAEPLRFVFSHSALREGWDNPNVFVICTLATAHSRIRKRQEIGRGLRLPVRVTGERCWDPTLNRLTIVANDSYRTFAAALQREHSAEWGTTTPVRRAQDGQEARTFLGHWAEIGSHLRWDLQFDTEALIARAAAALRRSPRIEEARLRVHRARLGADGAVISSQTASVSTEPDAVPDLLDTLCRRTQLSRSTVAAVLVRSERLDDCQRDPMALLDAAELALRSASQHALGQTLVAERLEPGWKLRIASDDALPGDPLELPRGFTVTTPLGAFRPHRAIWTSGSMQLCRLAGRY